MKIWEIEAQSLRLMFADSGIEFSQTEFTNGSIANNANTKEKLVRMVDSIRRGIDVYYTYVGEALRTCECSLALSGQTRLNKVVVSATDFGFPSRVDLLLYNVSDGVSTLALRKNVINFVYDPFSKEITFSDQDYTKYYTDYTDVTVAFAVWYRTSKLNIPMVADEMTYDLDTIFIPAEVQRKLPLFVKGELYEQDEYSLAMQAKNEFISFCLTLRKPFANVQTKVKRARIFDKE